jgi:hypothetical protein
MAYTDITPPIFINENMMIKDFDILKQLPAVQVPIVNTVV